MTEETEFESAVRKVLNATTPGEVLSYGELAAEAGYPGAARAVGNFLKNNSNLAWWRVVAANGRLHPHGKRRQAELLRREGVKVENHRVKF